MFRFPQTVGRALLPLAFASVALALGAGPAAAETQAGYDKGFFIKSDAWEIHFGTRMQLQYSMTSPDTFMYDSTLGKQEDTENLNELNVRRFKFYMNGTVFKPALKWKVQFDIERFKPGGGGTGNLRLEEAYLDLTQKPWWQLRLGQFKVPYGYEKMTSSGKLNIVDRSIVHSFFGIDQEPGVNLYGMSFDKKFRYDVAVTTGASDNKGFDTRNEVAASGESDFRYMMRGTWEPLAPYAWEQGAVSHPDKPQLSVQLGVMLNKTAIPQDKDPFLPSGGILPFKNDVLGAKSATFADLDVDPDGTGPEKPLLTRWSAVSNDRKPYDRLEYELVAAFKYSRFAIEGQYITGDVDPEMKYLRGADDSLKDLAIDNTGLRLQGGIFILPTRLEVAGRWASVDREAKASFTSDPSVKEEIDQSEWRIGLNWYFSRHDWKWQFDYGEISSEWALNGTNVAVPKRSDFPGPPPGSGYDNKVISNNTRKDKEFRTQFQIQF